MNDGGEVNEVFLKDSIESMDNITLLNLLVIEITNNTNCASLEEVNDEVDKLLKKMVQVDKVISSKRARELMGES